MVLTIIPGKLNVGLYAAICTLLIFGRRYLVIWYTSFINLYLYGQQGLLIMKYSPRDLYLAQKQFRDSINKIPKKNKQKFSVDLIKLIEYAQKDNYDNFDF